MKKVLGIGNALVDILIGIENDDFLNHFGLAKGSMTLVNREIMNNILNKAGSSNMAMQKSSGGSVANAIHGMSQLGAPVGYIGKTGADDYGSFFRSYMEQNNIDATLFHGNEATGKSIIMVSPDSERTMATYLGAAIELEADDLTIEPFKGYDYFLLEGYLVQNYSLVEKASALAQQAGCQIAIDLASFNIVKENLNFLHTIVEQYVDIVFANEEEAKSFTGKSDPREALIEIAQKCRIAVVKIGKDGSLIKAGCCQYDIAPIAAAPVDTTGAGDLYAAGFFYGLTCGHSLDICGKIGSITSGKIVEVIGAKMDDRKWQEVIHLAKKI
ncbi:MAG: adenosine kinase [Acidobacteria bacterium]|jgi:sugar/nucleoside kinase (ribokinase family)|nr:adenosine kinase [Acidobacteriota bacterium]